MNVPELLKLPDRFLIQKRIPKTVLINNNDLRPSEKKIVRSDIAKMQWEAVFKQNNANIPSYRSEDQIYDEVHIIKIELNLKKNYTKIADILQKTIPYPLLLWFTHDNEFCLNTTFKKINQNDPDKRTIEKHIFSNWWKLNGNNPILNDFFINLQPENLSHISLKKFYEDIILRIRNLNAAEFKGFYVTASEEETKADESMLQRLKDIKVSLKILRNQLKKETQFNKKFELNLQIKNYENEKTNIISKLAEH
jgi:hypothetical protein